MSDMTDISTAAESARESHRTTNGQFGTQEHSAPEMSLPALHRVQWTPGDYDTLIASGTNPWVQVDGEPVDLAGYSIDANVECDCNGNGFEGVVLAMDTREGIQRCDVCQKFESDLDAAQRAAEVLAARTGREHTIWFTPQEKSLPAVEPEEESLPPLVDAAEERYASAVAVYARRRDYLNRQFDSLRLDEADARQQFVDEILPGLHPDAVKVTVATHHLGGPAAEIFDANDEPIALSVEQKTQRAHLARVLSTGLHSGVHVLHLSPPAPTKAADPRYVPGVSAHDDDLSDAEWFEAMGPA